MNAGDSPGARSTQSFARRLTTWSHRQSKIDHRERSISEHIKQADRNVESTETSEQPSRTEYVERSDVGVSLTVKLTRGTGTRDQDKIVAKAKDKTLEDAREDMETLRENIPDLAEDARQIQPADPHK
jgi:hypothetical protein